MITKTNQSLSAVFDVEPIKHEVIESKPIVTEAKESISAAQEIDFEIARNAMHNLLLKGQSAIENALLIANGTEEAESYNAVSNLIGKVTQASTRLMELHEIKTKLVIKAETPMPTQESSNTVSISGPVFVGTTSELSKMLTNQHKTTNTTTIEGV